MFLVYTPTATAQVRAAWCLTTHGPRMCKALALAMADPPPDDAPGEDCPDHGPYVEDCDKCD